MTIRRMLVLSAVLASAVAAAPGQAATATCKLLIDGSGDATLAPMAPNIAPVDILSGDVATGKNNLVGVLRLASLATDPQTSGGATYSLSWSANGTAQKFGLVVFADGSTSADFTSAGVAQPASAVVDRSASTITWTISRKSNSVLKAATKAKPVKLTALSAAAQPATNVSTPGGRFSGSYNGDSADNGKPYLDSTASCVKGT